MKKFITVFGSSLPRYGDKDYEEAYKLGRLLAECGFGVCTGGYQGVMDAVSRGASEGGGEAIGVTVDKWGAARSKYLTKEIKCETLFERILKLVDLGDGYVILPGGTGTLLELAAVWEFMNKNLIGIKPAACHSRMWKEVIEIMERQIELEGRRTKLVQCFDTVEMISFYLNDKLKIDS